MVELERLGRLDELRLFDEWGRQNPGKAPIEYIRYRASVLQELGGSQTHPELKDADKLHATREAMLELLTTLQKKNYGNANLSKFLIDVFIYRIQAIWKSAKIAK